MPCAPQATGRRVGGPVEKRAFHVNEFCERYGISRSTVYELFKTGKLHSVLVGGRRLIPKDAAEALLKEGA